MPTFGIAVVRGRSMQPTLFERDRLLVRYAAVPRPGRLVVVRLPDGVVAVKRAVFLDADGWWVQRDNPAEGVDSWSVGAIAEEDLVAVVVCRLWLPWRPRSRWRRGLRAPWRRPHSG